MPGPGSGQLTSYDSAVSSQDIAAQGRFGNLIALLLQEAARELNAVFVDEALQPFPDQWAFQTSVRPMAPHDIAPTILRAIRAHIHSM
ncbi:MAG: hypothetical protein IPP44_00150 [Ideonella sp.]|nr:hypothetical protein [Ideonella sp.]